MQEEKKETRGRKKGIKIGTYRNHKSPEQRAKRKPCLNIVGEQEQLDKIRQLAEESGKSISLFIIDKILNS